MELDTREISEISFGLYSAKEILGMAVCKVDNPKKSGPNTVYDDRMGTTDSTKKCKHAEKTLMHARGILGT